MLDAHQLKIFLIAAETLNFSEAAKKLNMSQPSVSQHIQSLEARFGTALFKRSGRKMILTDAGVTLLPHARNIVNSSIKADKAMESIKNAVSGSLLIGCTTTPGKYVLPSLVANYIRSNPLVDANILLYSRDLAIQKLIDKSIDFCLVSSFQYNPVIQYHRSFADPIVLIAPEDHPWSNEKEIELDDLKNAAFLLRDRVSGTFQSLRDEMAKHGLDIYSLPVSMTLGSSEAIAVAVQEGVGVGFVSRVVAKKFAQNRVKIISIRDFNIYQEIYICRLWREPSSTLQDLFWEEISSPNNPIIKNLESNHFDE